jgi:hypothetical protein
MMLQVASASALPRSQWLPNLGGLGTVETLAIDWLKTASWLFHSDVGD